MKMMAIRLLSTCIIAGLPRSPVEGIQTVAEDEATRLIDLNMAEPADVDDQDEDGDGLDGTLVSELRDIAKREGAQVESNTKKDGLISAIRDRRLLFADSGIDVQPDEGLRKIATDKGLTIGDDADTAALLGAIAEGGNAS